jgi:hypothetical protein
VCGEEEEEEEERRLKYIYSVTYLHTHYSITVLQYYSITVLQYYSISEYISTHTPVSEEEAQYGAHGFEPLGGTGVSLGGEAVSYV